MGAVSSGIKKIFPEESVPMNPLTTVRGAITAGFAAAIVLSLLIAPTTFHELGLARWLHILTGITWIGLLSLILHAVPCADSAPGITTVAAVVVIGLGVWLGTFMLFNVWVLIWPNQKKILGIVAATDEEKAAARKTAMLASRTNFVLSIPMLLCMGSATHGLPF